MTKRYQQRAKKISVRPCDNPTEYARQYYWVVVKGKAKAPTKAQVKKRAKRRRTK